MTPQECAEAAVDAAVLRACGDIAGAAAAVRRITAEADELLIFAMVGAWAEIVRTYSGDLSSDEFWMIETLDGTDIRSHAPADRFAAQFIGAVMNGDQATASALWNAAEPDDWLAEATLLILNAAADAIRSAPTSRPS